MNLKTITQPRLSKIIIDFCLGKYKFIFISGNGGTGKSTFSKELVKEINSRGLEANLIDMDDFLTDSKMRKNSPKIWEDVHGNKRIGYHTHTFKESYHLNSLETIMSSLVIGESSSYIHRKSKEILKLNGEFPITIIEGVGTAYLEKNETVYSIFMSCDFQHEMERRIARARGGEADIKRNELKSKMEEWRDQFEVMILPKKKYFDLELWSLEDHSFRIDRDGLRILHE